MQNFAMQIKYFALLVKRRELAIADGVIYFVNNKVYQNHIDLVIGFMTMITD